MRLTEGKAFAHVPLDVYFIITRICNFNCSYCIREPMTSLPQEMSVDLFNSICNSFQRLKIRKLIITGGEPLLHPKFDEIIKRIPDSYDIVVCTNGWLLKDKLLKITEMRKCDILFQISLDAVGDNHDKIVNLPGAFKEVIQGIQFANKHNIKPIISTTVGHLDASAIIQLFQLLKEFNIDTWKISAEMPCSRSNGENMLSDAVGWNVLVKTVHSLNGWGGIQKIVCDSMFNFANSHLNQQLSSLAKELAGCGAGKQKVYFRTDGSISLCPLLDRYKVYPPQEDFYSWWLYSKDLLEFREFPATRLDECSDCEWLEICKGGCHGASLYKYNSIFHADPRCPMAKSKKR